MPSAPILRPQAIIEGPGGGGGTTSPLTTKGDLYGFTTGNARIPVGTDGFVLTADSAQSPGVGWGTRDVNFNGKNVTNPSNLLVGGTTWPTLAGGLTALAHPLFATNNTGLTISTAGGLGFAIAQVDSSITLSASGANTTIIGLEVKPTVTFSDGQAGEQFFGFSMGTTVTGSNTLNNVTGLNLTANIAGSISSTTAYGINGQVVMQSSGTITTAICLRAIHLRVSGTTATAVGLDITNMGSATTTWGYKVANYQSFHQGSIAFGAQAAPVFGIDLQALNGGNPSVIGLAGTNVAPASNPPSNSMWFGLWKGTTNYSLVIAFNDAGQMRFTSISPLQSTTVPSFAKGTSLPA